jgi:hypothetical protein
MSVIFQLYINEKALRKKAYQDIILYRPADSVIVHFVRGDMRNQRTAQTYTVVKIRCLLSTAY